MGPTLLVATYAYVCSFCEHTWSNWSCECNYYICMRTTGTKND